jgi:hypothetical protein
VPRALVVERAGTNGGWTGKLATATGDTIELRLDQP